MIIKIHQACSTKNALFYNERKVERHFATFFQSKNTPEVNPFHGDKSTRYGIFKEIEDRNTRVRKPGLHISVNPTVDDLVRLGDTGIRTEIGNLMKHLGYGYQPYLVYKHTDLERVHFHIVSTRIDCDTGKKITDSYEKKKTHLFIKDLEQKYKLTKDEPREKTNYRFSGSSKNLRQNLESLFGQLNRMDFITSKEMYDQALKLFNVEIRKAGRGYSVFVTDENGSPVRHSVKLGDFEERPKSHKLEWQILVQNNKPYCTLNEATQNQKKLSALTLKELIVHIRYSFCHADNSQMYKQRLADKKKRRIKLHR